MAASGLAAAILERRDREASSARSPQTTSSASLSDHQMRTRGGRGSRYVVTIGNEASLPATGFGYIGVGEPLAIPGAPNALWHLVTPTLSTVVG